MIGLTRGSAVCGVAAISDSTSLGAVEREHALRALNETDFYLPKRI
jgi:hypothetical protein